MKKILALFILLSLCATDVLAQGTTPNPNRVGGSVNGGGGGGSGSVTVVGGGVNLTSTDIVTGGGLQTIQTPSANAKIDSSGNISALSFISGGATPANSGVLILNGLTSGSVALSAADIAGTAITYVLPSTNGSAGQFLKDNGVTTCPTLASGAPTTCHLLAWATVSGSGTVTSVTFTGDGTVLSSTPSSAVTAAGTLTATLATQTANTVLGALTATTPSGLALPSCSTASSALKWTSGTGFGCNSSITANFVPPTVTVVTQSATPVIPQTNANGVVFSITALAQAITSMTSGLSGSPANGAIMEIQFTDNGTARAITWGTSFTSSTVSLPTTTVISTLLHVFLQYDSASSKWICVGVA